MDEGIRARIEQLDGWHIEDGMLKKRFRFDDFQGALEFVNRIGDLAEQRNHHPDLLIQYNEVEVSLMTHDENEITDKDVELAGVIEKL